MNKESISTIEFCQGVPELPDPIISRPHLVETLVEILDSKTEIVFLEGLPGSGKSIFIREFWQTVEDPGKHGSPCFGVFLRSSKRSFNEPMLTRIQLSCQLYSYVHSRMLSEQSNQTEGELRKLWSRCARKLDRENKTGYVIIDGIYHFPDREDSTRQSILNLLPLGSRQFKFIFSSDNDSQKFFKIDKYFVKTFPIPKISLQESSQFLRGVVENTSDRSTYHSWAGGSPSKLASIRRLLEFSDTSIQSVSQFQNNDIDSLFEAEWQQIEPLSQEVQKVLGFLIAYGAPVDTEYLAAKCSLTLSKVEDIFQSIPFVNQTAKTESWDFSTDVFRRFAEKKLNKSVKIATKVIAKEMLEKPESDEAYRHLPYVLEQGESVEKIRNWLNAKQVASTLLKDKSSIPVESILQSAIRLCSQSKDRSGVIAYSIIKSTIRQISRSSGMEYEIRARCALGDFEGALSIANDVPLHTQRLRLLSVLAASESDHPKQSVVEEIRELYRKIDISELSDEEIVDIATDLYPVDVNLSLNILKEILQGGVDNSNFEIAVARITLESFVQDKTGTTDDGGSKKEFAGKHNGNEKLQKLIRSLAKFNDVKSGSELLEVIDGIEDTSARLFAQRKWVSHHPERDDALEVVQNAISEAISVVEYAPNATFYREIAMPLPFASDKKNRAKVISILDGQNQIIQTKGPTIDYVRLQLCLIRCNCIDNELTAADNRIFELFFDTLENIEEIEDKITCLAWAVAVIDGYDLRNRSSELNEVSELIDNEFTCTLDYIFRHCAHQYEILSRALEALAKHKPVSAFEISKKLNTVERRNYAYLRVVSSMCEPDASNFDDDLLFKIFDEIEISEIYDSALYEITKHICREFESNIQEVNHFDKLILRLEKISATPTRMRCLARISKSMSDMCASNLREEVGKGLLSNFNAISSPRTKYQLACSLIASHWSGNPELVKSIYEYLADPDRDCSISECMEAGYYYLAGLVIKITHALAKSNLLKESEFKKICLIINKVDEPHWKVNLFSKLAFFLWKEDYSKYCSKLVQHYILIHLNNSHDFARDRSLFYRSWSCAYPVIWLVNRDSARKNIEKFPRDVKEECISNLIDTLLRKQPIGDPFDYNVTEARDLEYVDIQNLLTLCKETGDDGKIFFVFQTISSSVVTKKSTISLTRDQKAEIARNMFQIAESQLPVATRIQHTGYQILCKAQALRIYDSKTVSWDTLINEGKSLENTADRVFVLAYLASYLSGRLKKKSAALVELVIEETKTLNSSEDRINRYLLIAELILPNNKSKASEMLRIAFQQFTIQPDERREIDSERRLIDAAYRVDPDLPLQLAIYYDDDPARDAFRKRVQNRIDAHSLKKEIGDTRNKIDFSDFDKEIDLTNVFWRATGSLNSGRMTPVDIASTIDIFIYASRYPLEDAYPYILWGISNVMLKYEKTDQAEEYLHDFLEGTLQGVEFIHFLMEKDEFFSSSPEWREIGNSKSQLKIREGDREIALGFIREWLMENAANSIVIMDPYFSDEDLEILRIIVEINPDLPVQIITGKMKQPRGGSLSSAYLDSWRGDYDHSPPETEVLVVGTAENEKCPLHDRYILTNSAALFLGTSINSLGKNESSISVVRSDDVDGIYSTIKRYKNKEVREYSGERVLYESFELSF